ncbi:MAG TPA: HlyD family type I secretion periplasmic adaptor subunit [Steroidobacter sp.]
MNVRTTTQISSDASATPNASPVQGEPVPLSLRLASALFEIEMTEPTVGSRRVLKMVCVLFGLLLLWALFAKLDIVAVAEGRLVPATYVKIVQPAEAGIVREIRVREGERVQAGQVLIRLDPTLSNSDHTAVARELHSQRLQLRRIEAELAGTLMKREPEDDPVLFAQVEAQRLSHRQAFLDAVAQQVAARERAGKDIAAAQESFKKLEVTLPSYRRTAAAYQKLAEDKLMSALQAEEKAREATEKAQDLETQRAAVASAEATLAQVVSSLAETKSSYESDLHQSRQTAIAEANRLEQQLAKVNFQQGLLELRAPQAGIVKELATTTIGAVVEPGTVLLSLVPHDEPLLAEVQIENKDIGFVVEAQPVRVKLTAYPFQKYGMLEGTVRTISADASARDGNAAAADQMREPAFRALVQLNQQVLAVTGRPLPLSAGMQVSAEIVQGRRTVLEYLLSPVQRVMSEAATER